MFMINKVTHSIFDFLDHSFDVYSILFIELVWKEVEYSAGLKNLLSHS